MFKPLKEKLGVREKKMGEQNNRAQKLANTLNIFFKSELGKGSVQLGILTRYNSAEDALVIRTQTKTLATELVVRSSAIKDFLRDNGVSVRKVIVQ